MFVEDECEEGDAPEVNRKMGRTWRVSGSPVYVQSPSDADDGVLQKVSQSLLCHAFSEIRAD